MTQVDRTVSADEAGKTAAQPNAVTGTTVTTRVVGTAVRRVAGATDESWRTNAAVTGGHVDASTVIKTWL